MPEVKRIDVLVQVHQIRAESYPARQLVFDLGIVSTDVQLCVLNSWAEVYLGDACIAQGPLLQVFSPLVLPTTIGGLHNVSASVRAALTPDVLEVVEERRAGKDLPYKIGFSVAAIPVKETLLQPQYGFPQTVHFKDRNNNAGVAGTIPQSDWIQLLRQLGWRETQLVELPLSVARNEYPNALRHFEEACEHFRRGSWNETMGSCRKVAEAVAGKLGGYTDKGVDMKKLRLAVGPGAKGDQLNEVAIELGKFLHLGRHESGIPITRADALLALHMTTALFAYWCRPKSAEIESLTHSTQENAPGGDPGGSEGEGTL